MFTTEILETLVTIGGHIEVLRGPTAEYITVCRPDGTALLEGDMPPETLGDLLRQSYAYKDGVENEKRITTYRLTPDGKRAVIRRQN